MPKFITLYSGSSGNAGVVEMDGRFLLVDIGASCRATVTALEKIGLAPENLDGILITHEHIDHVRGLKVFAKKVKVPVFAGSATIGALEEKGHLLPDMQLVEVDRGEYTAGEFVFTSFPTSHDSAGCCGFRITGRDGGTMAIATDLGVLTNEVYCQLEGADLVALEANYDREMLRMGGYPYYLKKRIESPRGHLCNDESARTVAGLIQNGCRKLVLCHLSQENNHPNRVLAAVEEALFASGQRMPEDCHLQIARRHEPGQWIQF